MPLLGLGCRRRVPCQVQAATTWSGSCCLRSVCLSCVCVCVCVCVRERERKREGERENVCKRITPLYWATQLSLLEVACVSCWIIVHQSHYFTVLITHTLSLLTCIQVTLTSDFWDWFLLGWSKAYHTWKGMVPVMCPLCHVVARSITHDVTWYLFL